MSPDAPHDGTAPQFPPGLCALSPEEPAWIGSLRVVARIGTDTDPTVYAALTKTGRCLAIETYRIEPEDTGQEDEGHPWFTAAVEQRRGVRATCLLDVVEADPRADMPWLACDFVAGRSLAEHIRQFGPLSEQHLLCLAAGVGEALAAVHAAGFTHGDLSPERVVLSPHGPVVLAPDLTTFAPGSTTENNRPADMHAWAQLVIYAAGAGRVPTTDDDSDSDLAGLPNGLRTVVIEARAVTPQLRPSAVWATDAVLTTSGFTNSEREQQSLAWMVRDLLDLAWSDIDAAGHDPLQWRALAANPPRHAVTATPAASDESDHPDATMVPGSGSARNRRTGLLVALGVGTVGALVGLSVGGYLAAQTLGDTNGTTDSVADSTDTPPEAGTDEPDAASPEPSPDAQSVQFGNLTFHVPEEWEVDVETAGVAIPGTLEIDTNNPACADAEQPYLAGLSECGVLVFYGPERISGLEEFAEDPAVGSLAQPLSEHHPAHSLSGEPPPCHTAMEVTDHNVSEGEHVAVQQEDFAPLGGHEAHHREWVRPCVGTDGAQEVPHNEQTYIQRDWFLPEEQIYVVDEWNTGDLSEILADAERRD